jgi:aspartate/methionine/tyrosine aminotransferase
MWVPSAGYFVLADIETVDLEEHHYYHEGFAGRLPKDYAFCLKLCKEDGVIAIPCSSFFGKHKKNKDNLVRFAFCKDDMSMPLNIHRLGCVLMEVDYYSYTLDL